MKVGMNYDLLSSLIKRTLPLALLWMLVSAPFLHATSPVDKELTSRISGIIQECAKLKAGTTRTELMKHFTIEGGIYSATAQTLAYRTCPYIKVDVVFVLADSKEKKESPQDVLITISKPYLEFSISD
jgi:hypothetical protein